MQSPCQPSPADSGRWARRWSAQARWTRFRYTSGPSRLGACWRCWQRMRGPSRSWPSRPRRACWPPAAGTTQCAPGMSSGATGPSAGSSPVLTWPQHCRRCCWPRVLHRHAPHRRPGTCLACSQGLAAWLAAVHHSGLCSGKGGVDLLQHDHDVLAVAFRPDGKLLASATLDAQILFWDPAEGELQVSSPKPVCPAGAHARACHRTSGGSAALVIVPGLHAACSCRALRLHIQRRCTTHIFVSCPGRHLVNRLSGAPRSLLCRAPSRGGETSQGAGWRRTGGQQATRHLASASPPSPSAPTVPGSWLAAPPSATPCPGPEAAAAPLPVPEPQAIASSRRPWAAQLSLATAAPPCPAKTALQRLNSGMP